MKVRILLSYEGTGFSGWQKQKKERTVQGELEKALENLFQRKTSVFASGRTDRGAHALGQVAHFEIPEEKIKKVHLTKALNHLTPPDISLLGAWKAPKEFHARFSAKKKTYLFLLSTQKTPLVLMRHFVWWKPGALDIKKLGGMAQIFQGRHDFRSFQNAGSSVTETVKTIYEARWRKIHPSLLCFSITGSKRIFETNDKKPCRNPGGDFKKRAAL